MIRDLAARVGATEPPRRPCLVAVIGPPGAGKSSVVAALREPGRHAVFRLRDAIRARPKLLTGLPVVPDPLGWVSIDAVRRVVDAVFVQDGIGSDVDVVLLDNFPGTADQLLLISNVAVHIGATLTVLELVASAGTVSDRVGSRRVCQGCGPDDHAPAVADPQDPGRCIVCQAPLKLRDTDAPHLHRLRLERFYANRQAIAAHAAERGIPHLTINADAPLPEVGQAARRAVARLTATVEPLQEVP